jgi:hypothetical protein
MVYFAERNSFLLDLFHCRGLGIIGFLSRSIRFRLRAASSSSCW